MAIIFPDRNVIENLHQKPTDGEITLLNFLDKQLGQDYEIFFESYNCFKIIGRKFGIRLSGKPRTIAN